MMYLLAIPGTISTARVCPFKKKMDNSCMGMYKMCTARLFQSIIETIECLYTQGPVQCLQYATK